jgi:hypothetical protein
MAVVSLLPGGIVSDGGDALSANGLVTSNSICAVAVFPLLPVPVRLIEYESTGAPAAAATFRVSVSLDGMLMPIEAVVPEEAKLAVSAPVTMLPMPLVIEVTVRVTGPVNDPSGKTATGSARGALPAAPVKVGSAGITEKLPVCTVT